MGLTFNQHETHFQNLIFEIIISVLPQCKHEGFKNFFQTKSHTKCLLCLQGIVLFITYIWLPFLEHAYFAFLMNRNGFKASIQKKPNQAFFLCV